MPSVSPGPQEPTQSPAGCHSVAAVEASQTLMAEKETSAGVRGQKQPVPEPMSPPAYQRQKVPAPAVLSLAPLCTRWDLVGFPRQNPTSSRSSL